MTVSLRIATPADAAACAEIYGPHAQNGTATLEFEAPTAEEMARRMQETLQQLPYLVCQVDGAVAGYCYGYRFGQRPGYNWAAVASVYIGQPYRRLGLGRLFYAALEKLLAIQGYRSLHAVLTCPNPASEAFHQKMGFEKQGFFPNIAYKFGRPLGVIYYTKPLLPVTENPPTPLPFPQLEAAVVQDILARAVAAHPANSPGEKP